MNAFEFLLLTLLAAALAAIWRQRLRNRSERDRAVRENDLLRQAHAAVMHAQTARMEAMLDSMMEGLIVIDGRNRITLANRAAERLFGFSRTMVGGTLLEVIRHHEVAAVASRVNAGEAVVEHEVRLERPPARVLQINAVALRDAAEAPVGAVLVFHDITRLRELEGLRQDFVANVSHELRTPLSLIKSAAETLIDGGKDDAKALARFLEIIDKNANRLTLLIDDLLLLARLDAGNLELRLTRVGLAAIVREVLDDLTPKAKVRGVTLEGDLPDGITALADAERLRQVLANLIDNAIKYGAANGRVRVTAVTNANGRVEIAVADDGPGIPEEAQARIFERFYRIDKARSREQGGTGLGLAIVKNIIQTHGGEVGVESSPGTGTKFLFSLPGEKR
jgi:two-component system phosphate regulon sensor histidine kinase PhoR